MSMDNNTLYWGKKWRLKTRLRKIGGKLDKLYLCLEFFKDELKEINKKCIFKPKNIFYVFGCSYTLLSKIRCMLLQYKHLTENEDEELLYSYKCLMESKYNIYFERTNIQHTTNRINLIGNIFKDVEYEDLIFLSKSKFFDLMDKCLLNLEAFYSVIKDFVTEESKLMGFV